MDTIHANPTTVSFPIPRGGERDPHFHLTRTDWIPLVVPSAKRPKPPIKSFKMGGQRGRRLIIFESAREYIEKTLIPGRIATERRSVKGKK